MSKLLRPGVSGNSSLQLTERLELRSTIVVHSESGEATHLECRLFRLVPALSEPDRVLPTAAGFRVPVRLVPGFLDQLRGLHAEAVGSYGVPPRTSGERTPDRMPA